MASEFLFLYIVGGILSLLLIVIIASLVRLRRFNYLLAKDKIEVAEERARDQAILSSIGDGLIVVDPAGCIIVMNQAAKNLLGLHLRDVVGKPVVEVITMVDEKGNLLPTEDRPIHIVSTSGQAIITTTVTATTYYFLNKKNNSRFPAAITATPIMVNKKMIGVVVVFRDISKEKDVDKAKTEFVSLASHQLRTPLTAINWYIEMLLSGDAGKFTDEQRSYLQEVYRGSKRMVDIVNEFLSVSRLETGRLKIDPKPIELISFIEDIITEVEPLAKARNCTFTFNHPAGKLTANLDAFLMRQVVHNFLTNALRYSKEGKCQVVVKFSSTVDENYVVSVKDDGIGIPKAVQSRIFEKFFRTENAVAAVTEGSGIGLYMSKMIAEASGGRIWFESIEGQGSTFYLSFPSQGVAKKEGVELPSITQSNITV